MIEAKDFSRRNNFPGQTGNLFDVILHRAMALEEIPGVQFFILLTGLTFLGFWTNGYYCLSLLFFFIFDWISISLLPTYKRSFGPVKPQVLLLALCRMIPVIFSGPVVWIPLEIIGCFLQVHAFWFEPYRIHVTRQVFITEKFPPGSHFKIMHIGDLHLERYSIREKRLNELVSRLCPDVILFSGDYLCLSSIRDKAAWTDLQRVLREWQAPLGIFGVTGSPAVDLPENFPDLLEKTPVNLLNDEIVELRNNEASLQIIGLNCTHKPHEDYPRLREILGKLKPGFRLLLHHSPDISPLITDGGIDLQLAGHTHGGQVCLPLIGALFTGSLYGTTFQSGRYTFGNLVLYITRGLGLEGLSAPRVRFFCPPEIILWDISGKL